MTGHHRLRVGTSLGARLGSLPVSRRKREIERETERERETGRGTNRVEEEAGSRGRSRSRLNDCERKSIERGRRTRGAKAETKVIITLARGRARDGIDDGAEVEEEQQHRDGGSDGGERRRGEEE
ncbi:unnamed protein product [Calypogeia fissa]